MDKQPIGVLPRSVWDYHRVNNISEAMGRYLDAGLDIPEEWSEELIELCERYING